MTYYARSKENEPEANWQLLVNHCKNTATLAKNFADKFNGGEFAYILGLMHDIGKFSDEFQQKLRGKNLRVDHSTAGAKEVYNIYGNAFGKLLAYCIAGHHAGLPDYGNGVKERFLYARLSNKKINDYSAYKTEITLPPMPSKPSLELTESKSNPGFTIAFFIRMLYSCLTDADFLDTENFLTDLTDKRGQYPTIHKLDNLLDQFLSTFGKNKKTRINQKRSEIQKRCLDFSSCKPGMFTLTVPTGGGKTYSSLAFAMKHAKIHHLDRIIYVIPYTSIIEQNAGKFKDVLGEDIVLEHHSNIQIFHSTDDNKEEVSGRVLKKRLAIENWDIPLIVTTNVQFYESLFSNRSSRCRKLHNIVKSVIILDEAQMLPVEYLKPCLYALSELVINYGSTVVLCTATQPALKDYLPDKVETQEIMDDPEELYHFFRRVKIKKRVNMSDECLVEELRNLKQALCIVNTKKHAAKLYERLNKESGVFHLSTFMCPAHRKERLDIIKSLLEKQQRCLVISTQLIEAGVDIDFPIVYRSMAGIDSIIQAAGRCNREGNLEYGVVHVFKSEEDYGQARGWLQRTAEVGEMIFRKYDDVTELAAVKEYFELIYDLEGEKRLDKLNIMARLMDKDRPLEFDFADIANKFKLINKNNHTVIIPYNDEANKLIKQAIFSPYPKKILRALQLYTVSLYEYQYQLLLKEGVLDVINDMILVLNDIKFYSENTGLIIKEDVKPSGEAYFA